MIRMRPHGLQLAGAARGVVPDLREGGERPVRRLDDEIE